MTRALIVVRLSHLTDTTTSPERQREVCERLCAERGWTVVGVAEDLDVSASMTSPFERPVLRKWLDQPEAYDAIVFWRVDRLVRRVTHLGRMIEWAEQHEVNLVSATEAHFDLSTTIGRALAVMVGVFAEMEADAISQRTAQTAAHLTREGRYRGGHPPFGYQPVKSEAGWRLTLDPVTSALARNIADRLLDGERPTTIVRDLNDRGVPTPQDHFRKQQGKQPTGAKWRTGNLVRAMRSPTMLGYAVSAPQDRRNGKRVRGEPVILRAEDGSPIQRAEPVLDRVTYNRVCAKLDELNGSRPAYSSTRALLVQVIFCGVCGRPAYHNRGRGANLYYRCSSASFQTSCGNRGLKAEDAEALVTGHLLGDLGDLAMHRREWQPGEDHAAELAEVDAQLAELADVWGTGPFRSEAARQRLSSRIAALEARRAELAALPRREAGWRYVPTGETFREHWERMDLHSRNAWLRDNGVRMTFVRRSGSGVETHIEWGDVPRMVRAIDPERADDIVSRLERPAAPVSDAELLSRLGG